MKNTNLRWLYTELPQLIEAGVISADDAKRIRDHFGPAKQTSMMRVAIVLCSALGATLIGSGIILILAHNWEDLSRPVRACIAFLPLLVGQGLAGWTLWKKNSSTAWREGSGAFLGMAIGASIALISQTYQIPGNLANFLFTWLILGLPALYLLRSTTLTVLYLIGTTAWVLEAQGRGGHALWYGPLLVAVLPFLWQALKSGRDRPRTLFIGWVFCLSLCVGLGVALEKNLPGLWIVVYSGLFAAYYLVGRTWYRNTLGQPFTIIGTIGTVILGLILTFFEAWRNVGYQHYRSGYQYYEAAAIQDYVIALGVLALVGVLCVRLLRQGDGAVLAWVFSPILALVFFLLMTSSDNEMLADVATVAFNIYLFILGVQTFASGVREGRLGVTNGGMAILALLFTFRFFDSDFSFVLRGVAFILLGSGFLVANLLMIRKNSDQAGELS